MADSQRKTTRDTVLQGLAGCVRLRNKYTTHYGDEPKRRTRPTVAVRAESPAGRPPSGLGNALREAADKAEARPSSPDGDVTDWAAATWARDASGVYRVTVGAVEVARAPRSLRQYVADLKRVTRAVRDGPTVSLSYQRLRLLESRFRMHAMLNGPLEIAEQKRVPHRDFYNVRKVDGHVHHSSSMNQKHLLRFIKHKLRSEGEEVVIKRDGKDLTLRQVFESLNLTTHDLSVDTLDVHADNTTFHRFDKFNLKYNPAGESRLREVFLKTDNVIKGRFLAELTREVIDELEANKYQMAEYRLSIYGRDRKEWSKLAAWAVNNNLFSENVRWLIQVPRLYHIHRQLDRVADFGEMLDNIFLPLLEVTRDPSSDPTLHQFLQHVVGFDTVDDESLDHGRIYKRIPHPGDWTSMNNPPYTYYSYYLHANISCVNSFRRQRGLSTFAFRPHAGEAGDTVHLSSAFLLADAINHGIMLRKAPVLQYLYYLTQIGISMSPLSNNSLFLSIGSNPFPSFFAVGMNMALSTDDPLQFHFSKEPLIEEYSVAMSTFKLTSCDACEIARNSVLQSGYSMQTKRHWIGDNLHKLPSHLGNDIQRTNVSNIRVAYRVEALEAEWQLMDDAIRDVDPDPLAVSVESLSLVGERSSLPKSMAGPLRTAIITSHVEKPATGRARRDAPVAAAPVQLSDAEDSEDEKTVQAGRRMPEVRRKQTVVDMGDWTHPFVQEMKALEEDGDTGLSDDEDAELYFDD